MGRKFARKAPWASLSQESLLWAVGLFCAFIGAFLLVAPHHFHNAPYESLLPFAVLWGTLALGSGVGLLGVTILRPPFWLGLAIHGLAGLTLLALSASFAAVGAVTGTVAYTVLGLGTILAGWMRRSRPGEDGSPGDLFALLMGFIATAMGFLALAVPRLFDKPFYGPYEAMRPVLGLAFLLTGPLLCHVQLARVPKRQAWMVHVFCGVAYVTFGVFMSLPGRIWTGLALYWGGGAVIALLPWVRPRLAELDPAALRTRLALTLAISTSVALILATAVATAQEEKLAEEQARETQRVEAHAIAQNVADYIEMNGARTFALATLAGRLPLTRESQREMLRASRRSYPDVTAFRTVAADGGVIAGAGAVPLPPAILRKLVDDMRANPRQRVQLIPATVDGYRLLLLWAPIQDLAGGQETIRGILVSAFDSKSLAMRIGRQGSRVSLFDGRGQPIADSDGAGRAVAKLPDGWDRDVRAGREVVREDGIAGFAVVPTLDWVVAVERPRTDALAGVRQGRDLAFGILLLVIPLAVLGGIFAARRIARPLGDLSSAVDELTAGNLAAPLGAASGITEVARLAGAFQEMRDRLAERTRESERLAAELRARAEALAETDRRKDEFLAMLAHELRNPLGAIANASYLMERMDFADPVMERSVAIIRRQIRHLVRMVDDLLDVSRITRGKVELQREPLDLMEVVRHAVEALRPLADGKQQRLSLELPAGPVPLHGDATRLEQVFSNLLRNAVKFTEDGGSIAVLAREDGHAEAVVLVRDDGIGISPALLPHVFDLFAQGEQALDRTGAGLGIGLTLVRSLVEMHGGRVEARSGGPGQGSELEVRLPLAPHPPAPSPGPPPTLPGRGGEARG